MRLVTWLGKTGGLAWLLFATLVGSGANTPAEIEAWKKSATAGDVNAQWNLALAYQNRDGVDVDPRRELSWKHSSAEGGLADAQYSLAADYFQGQLSLTRDVRTAVTWLRRAALQGHLEASYRLGEIYFHGLGGVGVNYAQVAAAMKKPAQSDYQDAKMYLGYLKFTGRGMAQDEAAGAALLREAAAAGFTKADGLMWEAHLAGQLEPIDAQEKLRWIEAGNRDGDLRASEQLGLALFLGQGIAQDRDRARPLLEEAAQRGSVPAATALAQEIGEQLADQMAELKAEQRQVLILEYNRMAHLIAVNGGLSGIETYLRAITHLRPMGKLVVVNSESRLSMGEDLIEALAWGRIYHAENGQDRAILEWSDSAEIWLRKYRPAARKVQERMKELLELSVQARAK